jgi:hypothetical protein
MATKKDYSVDNEDLGLLDVYPGTAVSSVLSLMERWSLDEVRVVFEDGERIILPKRGLPDAVDRSGAIGPLALRWQRG